MKKKRPDNAYVFGMPETALHGFKTTKTTRWLAPHTPELPLAGHTMQKYLFKFQVNTTTNNNKGAGTAFQPVLRKYTSAVFDLVHVCPEVEGEESAQ